MCCDVYCFCRSACKSWRCSIAGNCSQDKTWSTRRCQSLDQKMTFKQYSPHELPNKHFSVPIHVMIPPFIFLVPLVPVTTIYFSTTDHFFLCTCNHYLFFSTTDHFFLCTCNNYLYLTPGRQSHNNYYTCTSCFGYPSKSIILLKIIIIIITLF